VTTRAGWHRTVAVDASPSPSGIVACLKGHWRLKLIGIPLFIAVFFLGYFLTLEKPVFPVTWMPITPIDRAIAFHPAAISLYVSLWIYVLLAPAMIGDKYELVIFGQAASALAVVGLGIFFFWPTAVPNPDIDWSQYPSLGHLKTIDMSGNACPSLHVAYAVFSAIWINRLLRRLGERGALRVVSACWCAGIVYSTIATRQHVAVDVLAGAALGWLAALPRGRFFT
jgi:membrane-associated phospholipid phosphatase